MSDQPTTPENPEAGSPEAATPAAPSPEVQGTAPAEPVSPPQPAAEPAASETAAPPAAGEPIETTVTAEPDAPAPVAATEPAAASIKGGDYFWGTGRRKTAVARVRIRPGTGKFLIHKREINDFFFDERSRVDAIAPLKATKTLGKFDVFINVHGGGQTGQSGAIMLGLARALLKADSSLEGTLRDGKYLTRDDRKVERKKPGQPGARKRFQFSKR
ncbi:MAG: 30S ribosomal protein S9 [Planctomycetota bacterium]